MFGIEKDRVARVMNDMQKRFCAYGGGPRCDCKYCGRDQPIKPGAMSETASCCPELSLVFNLLSAMTKEEYAEICARGNIKLFPQ